MSLKYAARSDQTSFPSSAWERSKRSSASRPAVRSVAIRPAGLRPPSRAWRACVPKQSLGTRVGRSSLRTSGSSFERLHGHFRRAPRVEIRLQHHLRRHRVAPGFALLVRQPRGPQRRFREGRREPLVGVDDRQPGHAAQPRAECPRLLRLGPLAAGGVDRQADDQPADLFPFDDAPEVRGVPVRALALADLERRGDDPVGVADRQADADRAVVDAQQPRSGRRSQVLLQPGVFLSRSTSCLTVAFVAAVGDQRRVAVLDDEQVAHADRGDQLAGVGDDDAVRSCRCRRACAWTVLPSASCGFRRSRASQLPTSSHWYGACTTSTSPGLLHDRVVDADLLEPCGTPSRKTASRVGVSQASAMRSTAACRSGLLPRQLGEDRVAPSRRRCRCSRSTRRWRRTARPRRGSASRGTPRTRKRADALPLSRRARRGGCSRSRSPGTSAGCRR